MRRLLESCLQSYFLRILHRIGINPTTKELEDFENRIVKDCWDRISNKRMNEQIAIKNIVDATPIVLPNGRVGEQYKAQVEFSIKGVDDYQIIGLEALGLSLQKTDTGFCISGVAQPEDPKGGNFSLILLYKPEALLDGENWLEKKFSLVLNPDPESLWNDIPTPRNIDYFKEDFQTHYIKVGKMEDVPHKDLIAASLRGRSHAHEGKPRDDHFQICYCEDTKWYIIAVADGAGSAKYSRKGSQIACETSVSYCKEVLSDSTVFEGLIKSILVEGNDSSKAVGDKIYAILGNAALNAHNAIRQEAERKENATLKDYGTTLLLAICKRFDFGWFIASFWIGDGAMCVYDEKTHMADLLGTPDEGEFSGQTRFLTMPEIFTDSTAFYKRLRFKIYKDFTALILMTDGVSDPQFTTDTNLRDPEKWAALWKELLEKGVKFSDNNEKVQEKLLEWLGFKKRGEHDDRTIAILY